MLLSLCGFSQRDYIYGVVSDSSSSEAMIGVHVKNITAGSLTNTNLKGAFKIPAKSGDSLILSYIGYQNKIVVVDENTPKEIIYFKMSQNATMLNEVEVNVFPEYWRFKQLIVESQPVHSTLVVFGLDAIPLDAYELSANEQKIKPADYHAPTIGIGFDLGKLGKKGKEKRKVEKLLARQEMERAAHRKFNREWVAKETKLKGDELTDFIAFCKFTTEYLVESTVFDIHGRMMALLDDFQAQNDQQENKNYNPGA